MRIRARGTSADSSEVDRLVVCFTALGVKVTSVSLYGGTGATVRLRTVGFFFGLMS